jgi:hypothetical protein
MLPSFRVDATQSADLEHDVYLLEYISARSAQSLKEGIDDQMDICYFLADVYLFCPQASDILNNALAHYVLIPTLFNGFLYDKRNTV